MGLFDPASIQRMQDATATAATAKRCETCAFWQGNAGSYMGACTNEANYRGRTAWDHVCTGWTFGCKPVEPTA